MRLYHPFFLLPFLSLLLSIFSFASSSSSGRQIYVVYFGEHSGERTFQEIEDVHHSFLLSVKNSEEEARASLIYSYKNSINGFAALLSPEEAARLSEMEEVVSAFPSEAKKYSLHTSRSWEFLESQERLPPRASRYVMKKATYGKDVIVGLLDNGIWPESQSFSDKGMGPIPKSWRGICQEGDAFNSSHCNKKLIGARYYLKAYEISHGRLNTTSEYRSARDHDGHGTHTSSTVGGCRVRNVSSIGGFASGTVTGGAPFVRLAQYKVCWPIPGGDPAGENTCFEADMLAAMDDALGDGVDVISISIGSIGTIPKFNYDGIAIGAFHALKREVVVVASAGNSGPAASTVVNLAPWVITVAASSIDRTFPAPIVLGNGIQIIGQTVTPYDLQNKFYPLVFAADAVLTGTPKNFSAGQCIPGSLDPNKVKGKIVFCLRGNGGRVGKGMEVKRAGGAAFILGNLPIHGVELSLDAHVLPAVVVISSEAIAILNYINLTKNPMAKIIPAKTALYVKPAPFMAAFSSTGPNSLEPNILKPDITAPGLNILAAWSQVSPPTKLPADPRRVKYNLHSGTSMSCPHVAAAAAVLKALHPTWSSAAIRSALMTTASAVNNAGQPLADASGNLAGPFNYGSGHLRPVHASDPGLVYDASYNDYRLFLCSMNIQLDPSSPCPLLAPSPTNLNYPSVAISALEGTVTIQRTVTNVGTGRSIYYVYVQPPPGISVEISPKVLFFGCSMEKQTFYITFKAGGDPRKRLTGQGNYSFGWYVWSDGVHIVRSPMAVSLA